MNTESDITKVAWLLTALFVVLAITFLKRAIKRAHSRYKGRKGERYIKRKLSRLPRDQYRLFNNVLIGNGSKYTQIDHIVISYYGIFVIETKNYQGWIFGSDRQKHWTQTLGRKKFKLYNPVWQNNAHVRALKSLNRDFASAGYHPIVVFVGNVRLKKIDSEHHVILGRSALRYIKKFKEPLLSKEQIEKLAEDLDYYNKASNKNAVKRHKEHINARKSNNSKSSTKCPNCGSELIKRFGKHGDFIGCSNYPRCRYSRSAESS